MKLGELVAPLDAPEGAADIEITGVTEDSRTIEPGFLFAAIKGLRRDGREFIQSAIDKGAAAIIADTDSPEFGVPKIETGNVRAALSAAAARFYVGQPETLVAVTGTNGKSSTIEFLRQIWVSLSYEAATLGTLGVRGKGGAQALPHTTPGPVRLHQTLKALDGAGVTHLGMEASSHGLKQHRLDGVKLSAVGFTNLTQDHFDYHPNFEDYYAAKRRLFDELPEAGTPAVLNTDGEWGRRMAEAARQAGLDVRTVGWSGDFLKIEEVQPKPDHQILTLLYHGADHRITLPLVGEFQALNGVLAAGLAIATGAPAEKVLAALENLEGVHGRMENAASTPDGAQIFVDYAHTPDGLDKVLRALRPHTRRHIWLVFGAGGDRDPTKREKMGQVATRLADRIIVTDDNPRSEDPATIRAAVLRAAPGAEEIGERGKAIRRAVERLQPGDALVIAGKGHETDQIYGDEVRPFDDVEEARTAVADLAGERV